MIGLAPLAERTLAERALGLLAAGPCGADRLATDVFGLTRAPRAIAERLAVALLGADPRVHQLADGRWALRAEAASSPRLEDCAFAVVDVETTGLRARVDRITEVAVVLVQGWRREPVFASLVNPGVPIPPRIAAVTGITDDLVRHAPPFHAIADQVLAALSGRVFVAHHARFDWRFLLAELRRARGLGLVGTRLCTVRLARRLLPELALRSLDHLSFHFGLENQARHRAGGDALVTAEVLLRLLARARETGLRTLAELEALCARRSRPAS